MQERFYTHKSINVKECINRTKGKNDMTLSIDGEKEFKKQHLFMIKTVNILNMEGT